MWARSLLVVAVLAAPAAAEFDASPPRDLEPIAQTPRIRIGHPGPKLALDKIAVAIQQDALGTTAHLTLTVTTTDIAAREAVIALEVPRGARVTGVALTIGKTERLVAVANYAERARADYERVLQWGRDPVLVEWKGEAVAGDVLDVRAFPLTPKEPGRIELTIELPDLSALSIDARARTIEITNGGQTATHRKVTRPITIDVPRQRGIEAPLTTARPHVDPTTSFYVGFAVTGPMPTVTFSGRPHWHVRPPDKGEIKREIKRHIARLSHCYERAVQYKGGADGEAVLHFLIDPQGKIASSTIDGTLEDPEILSCLQGVVAQFEFRPGDGSTLVNYPLQFRLNRT